LVTFYEKGEITLKIIVEESMNLKNKIKN